MSEPTNTNQPAEELIHKRQRTRKLVFTMLIIVLSVINVLLLVVNQQGKKEIEQLSVKLQSTETLKLQLESDYKKISDEFKEYRGKNAQFDSLLALAQATIERQKIKIEELIRKGNVSPAEYAKAKQELEELKSSRDKFVGQIDSLEKKNKTLASENQSLKQTLDAEKENLKKLERQKLALEQKVTIGSILKAQNVTANGFRDKSNGEEVASNNIKKIGKLKICFEIDENKIAEKGEKKIVLRILNPSNSCISIPAFGSGSFIFAETGEVKEFTTTTTIDYNNEKKSVCVYWKQDKPYAKGKYTAEIYHEGYLIGKTAFDLK